MGRTVTFAVERVGDDLHVTDPDDEDRGALVIKNIDHWRAALGGRLPGKQTLTVETDDDDDEAPDDDDS